MRPIRRFNKLLITLTFLLPVLAQADVTRVEVSSTTTLSEQGIPYTYSLVEGLLHFELDPADPANLAITDIEFAPRNSGGMVEFAADFKMLVPSPDIADGTLVYGVNNRGGLSTPPEVSLSDPLAQRGYTYLVTGWINEISPRPGRIRLHAPVVGSEQSPITGDVRYEMSVLRPETEVAINGGGHLGYTPTEQGLAEATLTSRQYLADPRTPIESSRFEILVKEEPNSTQPEVSLRLDGGFTPGVIYELIYQAKDPVLAGAGMAGIRDMVSLLRYGGAAGSQLAGLGLPDFDQAVAYGFSQSGRLLRQFVYEGFNADTEGRIVFEGVVPFIAGAGFGMFNNRFAMPTRTNGQHSNYLYPNDLFPFTYGDSTDPFSGQRDGVLGKARAAGVAPRVMNIQTSNEYWVRGGSLNTTNPQGTADADIPDDVRIYIIGGSQHGSGSGVPSTEATTGQLPRNHNMWNPIGMSLVAAMVDWVAEGKEPPPSRYPRIADGTLVPSHIDGQINSAAWNPLDGYNHPGGIYQPIHASYGARWASDRIIDQHPQYSDHFYTTLVPKVDANNNDLPESTILPPLTSVPLGTFMPWNLRNPSTGGEKSLARLSGAYIPFAYTGEEARRNRDPRSSIDRLYSSYDQYLARYEQATDELIDQGYLLPGFKAVYMGLAQQNRAIFE